MPKIFRDYKLITLVFNTSVILYLFIFFDSIFRVLRFSLIYFDLNSFWNFYSNYYFLVVLFFSFSWFSLSIFSITLLRRLGIK